MSGGGGGRIIIRSFLRPVAESDSVQHTLSADELQRLQTILVKDESNWTRSDDRFVMHCIGCGLQECN